MIKGHWRIIVMNNTITNEIHKFTYDDEKEIFYLTDNIKDSLGQEPKPARNILTERK